MSEPILSFRDLHVYQAAFELQQRIFKVTKCFPKEETFSLTDQSRRASRAVGANIAEAWQKRRYAAHEDIGRKLGKMMAEPGKWCPRP